MYVLTDMQADALSFFEGSQCNRLDLKNVMTPGISMAAQAMLGEKTPHAFEISHSHSKSRFSIVLLSENARRSNLDTMTELLRKGVDLPEGLICAAYTGKGFLGRHDRSWICEPGNVHAVYYLKPAMEPAHAGPAFSILAALACVDTILRQNHGIRQNPDSLAPVIKWVNDVFVGRRKIAGVLTRQTFRDPVITDVLLGIGVNVLVEPDLDPDAFVPESGCLRKIFPRASHSPGAFLLALTERLEAWYERLQSEGVEPLLEFYRRHAAILGREVRIFEDGFGFEDSELSERTILAKGKVEAVLDDLSLKVGDSEAPISNGRLAFEEDCA